MTASIYELLAVVVGAAYLIITHITDSFSILFTLVLKCTPAFALSLKGNISHYLQFGLFLCCVGDAMLELDDQHEEGTVFFFLGLGSFLLAHVCFSRLFQTQSTGGSSWIAAVVLAFFLLLVLGPCLQAILTREPIDHILLVAVFIYGVVIAWMSYSAYIVYLDTNKRRMYPLFGSIVFIISDSALAWDRFVEPLPQRKLIVMLTYYSAIFLISRTPPGKSYQRTESGNFRRFGW
jgi:alkenylglycerophosphocholine hydrolase